MIAHFGIMFCPLFTNNNLTRDFLQSWFSSDLSRKIFSCFVLKKKRLQIPAVNLHEYYHYTNIKLWNSLSEDIFFFFIDTAHCYFPVEVIQPIQIVTQLSHLFESYIPFCLIERTISYVCLKDFLWAKYTSNGLVHSLWQHKESHLTGVVKNKRLYKLQLDKRKEF